MVCIREGKVKLDFIISNIAIELCSPFFNAVIMQYLVNDKRSEQYSFRLKSTSNIRDC